MNKMAYPFETMLLASAVDKLSLLLWVKTKDGAKNRNRPKMILEMLQTDPAQDITAFSTPELFENMWEQLAGGERIGWN